MKKNMKKLFCLFLTIALLLPTAFVHQSYAASFIKCYTISSGNTTCYSNTGLSSKYGTIYPTDELIVHEIGSKYCKVTYPISRGTKTGYIPTSAILLSTAGPSRIAAKQITTYRRKSTAKSYGYISKGDSVIELGTSGGYTQVYYPVSGGHKIAWIRSSDASWTSGSSQPLANGTYRLESSGGFRLDVNGGSNADSANIQLWQRNDTNAQVFRLEYCNNGFYKISNYSSGKVLDISGGYAYQGANVIQYTWHGGKNQQWKIVSSGNGYYEILSAANSGYALDFNGGINKNGTNVQVWNRNGSNAQKWKISSFNVSSPSNNTGLASPVPSGCKFSKKTNDNGWYGYHDINRNVSLGKPVYAIADGTVTYKQAYRVYSGVKYLTSYGNYIEFASSSGGYTAKYCHLNGFAGASQIISSSRTKRVSGSTGVYTISRRSVRKGEVIGYMGTTGNSSGVHLHFELRRNSARIDPTSVINGLT